jgi:hypothetical protein
VVLSGLWPALKMSRPEISRMMASEHHVCELMEVAKGVPPNTLLDPSFSATGWM